MIQVNVVSGTFSEKTGSSGVTYRYNGLCYLLSTPEFPNFQIRNLTRFDLEVQPSEDKHFLPVQVGFAARGNRVLGVKGLDGATPAALSGGVKVTLV